MLADSLGTKEVWANGDYNPADHKVVGILSQSVYWRDLIKNILPEGSDGIYCVFESPCNPTFTYELNGPTVRYLGVGDAHEDRYEHMGVSSLFQDLEQYTVGERPYSGLPLEQELCPWTIRVYPSHIVEDSYRTNNPIIFSVVAVLIFAFTTGRSSFLGI